MRKVLGITLGGLQKKTITLVLLMLLIMLAAFVGVSAYQNKMLIHVVGETRIDQQQAISQVSEETMHEMLEGALVTSTTLRANLEDSEFSEIINNVYMLQTMAQGLRHQHQLARQNKAEMRPLLYQSRRKKSGQ